MKYKTNITKKYEIKHERKYSFDDMKRTVRAAGLVAVVCGAISLAGCEGGGDSASDTENVWRAFPSTKDYVYLENQNTYALNLIEGDGINDLSATRFVDFLTEQEAKDYLGISTSTPINRGNSGGTSGGRSPPPVVPIPPVQPPAEEDDGGYVPGSGETD